MKCAWVQEIIVLYVFDELAADARHDLEQHVARCATCMGEVQAVKAFRADMAKAPAQEPSPNLLTDSRMSELFWLPTANCPTIRCMSWNGTWLDVRNAAMSGSNCKL